MTVLTPQSVKIFTGSAALVKSHKEFNDSAVHLQILNRDFFYVCLPKILLYSRPPEGTLLEESWSKEIGILSLLPQFFSHFLGLKSRATVSLFHKFDVTDSRRWRKWDTLKLLFTIGNSWPISFGEGSFWSLINVLVISVNEHCEKYIWNPLKFRGRQ